MNTGIPGSALADPTPRDGNPTASHQRTRDRLRLPRWAQFASIALVVMVLLADGQTLRHQGQQLGWLISAAVLLLLVVRGVHLGRPVTVRHLGLAAAVLASSLAADVGQLPVLGFVLLGASGALLVLPTASRPNPELLPRMAHLVDQTSGDPLAPFALHSAKSYFVGAGGRAAIGYRALFGIAVVGGDPIGCADRHAAVAAEFVRFCHTQGWRVAILGASDRGRDIWKSTPGVSRPVSVAFGRDVVLDIGEFAMVGRRFRNLRQAVQRARNAGVTTEIVAESDLPAATRAELVEVMARSGRAVTNRGFSMILDRLLEGRFPGLLLVIARDAAGQVVGFQRYASADQGRELSLDVPWRRADAPNGIDEAMTVAMVECAARTGLQGAAGPRRLSLALAPFPELFNLEHRSTLQRIAYRLVHLVDPLLAVESLYTYLRKFHALAGPRHVIFSWPSAVFAIPAFFVLEFLPRRRQPGATARLGERTTQGTIADVVCR